MVGSRRSGVALLCLGLVLAACGADRVTEEETPPADLVCDEAGYPCTWDEVPEDVFIEALELLDDAGSALRSGASPEDVAADLAEHPDVVRARHDRTGVIFRLDGAPPVVAQSEDASPVRIAAREGVEPPTDVGTAAGPGGEVVAATYEPPRLLHHRPRTAVVVEPFRTVDRFEYSVKGWASGDVPDGEQITPEEYASLFNRTEAVLKASEHVQVTVDHGFDVFTRFDQYDLVLLATHTSDFSGKEDCGRDPDDLCLQVLGGPVLAQEDGPDQAAFREAAYQQVAGRPAGTTIGNMHGVWYVALTSDFFASVYGPRGVDSIVIINACKPGGPGAANTMVDVIGGLASGDPAGMVFAWTDFIHGEHADDATARLASLLVDEGLPGSEALMMLEAEGLDKHTTSMGDAPVLQHHGRDLRARDVVTAQVNGQELLPGATIPVRGEPDDGADDVIRELSFLVEGVIAGEEDGAELTWQLPVRHSEPIRIENPFSDGPGRRVEVVDDQEAWRDLRVHLTDLDLEFDLSKDDLLCCLEHTLEVDVSEASGEGGPSRHTVVPVFLRQEQVEVLDPVVGQPLTPGDQVLIDGTPLDDEAEVYPLIVRLDHIDERDLPELVLEVTVHDQQHSYPSRTWTEVDEGTWRVEEDVELYDFPDDEEEIAVAAQLALPTTGTIAHEVDPLVLQLATEPPDCGELTSTATVNRILGTSFGSPLVRGSTCTWESEADLSGLTISVYDEMLFGAMDSLHENSPAWQVADVGTKAFYDEGGAGTPGSIQTDDGRTAWSAYVNLNMLTRGAWILIQPNGNIVVEKDIRALAIELARAIDDRP